MFGSNVESVLVARFVSDAAADRRMRQPWLKEYRSLSSDRHAPVARKGCSLSRGQEQQQQQLAAHFRQVVIMLDGDDAAGDVPPEEWAGTAARSRQFSTRVYVPEDNPYPSGWLAPYRAAGIQRRIAGSHTPQLDGLAQSFGQRGVPNRDGCLRRVDVAR